MVNQTNSIFELARSLCSNNDVDSLLAQLSAAVERLTESEAASILLLDDKKEQLIFKVATGAKGASVKKFYVPLGQGVAGWVAEHGQHLIVNNVKDDTRFTGHIDKSSGFSTRSIMAVPMFADGNLIGVCEALNKAEGEFTENDLKVLENLASLAAVTIHNAKVVEDYKNFFTHSMEIMTTAIEGSDSKMTGHAYRSAELACRIGRQMGVEGDQYRSLYYAALLHDIGMVAVHDLNLLPQVVNKTIERTPEKLHPLIGAELVKDIRLLSDISPIIRHHHENFDGSGHPDGLVGDDIPLASRILCLVEHVEDLYMKGLSGEEFEAQVAKLTTENSGTIFDPNVVDAYLEHISQAAA